MLQPCRSHRNIDPKYLGCFSHEALIWTHIWSHRRIRIWTWRGKHQKCRHSHRQEHIIPSNDTPVTPSQRPTQQHSVKWFFIHRVPIVFKQPNSKCTVHHQFWRNHHQTFCKFISLPHFLQLTPSNNSCCSIISMRTPLCSMLRIDRWRVFVDVLLYSKMKLIIHLTFMPFQILFHIVQHWTATVHKRRH